MRFDEVAPRFERLTLEKARVAAMQEVGPQFAHSMEAEVATDFITRNLVVRWQSEVLSHKDGTDEQEVWSEVEVGVPWQRKWVPALAAVMVGVGLAGLALGLAWLGVVGAGLASAVLLAYLSLSPQTVTARKPFRVKAERWVRFPENTMVYPKELGTPVVQIMARAEDPDDYLRPLG